MSYINYDNRYFVPKVNSANGEVNASTLFHYRQQEQVVWATYDGGDVQFGTFVARVSKDGSLDMRYSHVNHEGELMTGHCRSVPEVLAAGGCGCMSGGDGRAVTGLKANPSLRKQQDDASTFVKSSAACFARVKAAIRLLRLQTDEETVYVV